MKPIEALASVGLAMGVVCACEEGLPRTLGLDEPIRVHGGQFIAGALPGAAPDAGTSSPAITNITVTNPTVLAGQAGKAINGRASGDASAVGLRFADLGSGYWIVPMGPADGQFPGELTWQAISDFNPLTSSSAPGHHTIRFVAIDASGHAGTQSELDVCLEPSIPDNGAMCDPSIAPPAAVLTLAWDADVDIDLEVVGPDGRTTDPKHPTTIPPDGGVLDPTSGKIDRDSLAGCIPDERRQEDLVWRNAPPSGTTFDVYANLFDACGQRGATYTATVYTFAGGTPVAQKSAKGVFTSFDANGGAALGTYLFSYTF